MSESSETIAESAIENGSNPLHCGAIHCTEKFCRVARAIWPKKTAAHWAAAAGVKERMAKYWLARTHEISDSGKLALIRELQ